ncbi:hypothetical protein SCHPADRAFT_833389 [Schizopora paradoxa]|uniref:Uncharacterized protein n=1 Tax=Schizopora paradoxa TaxID=27342 RepID=A0A0H2RYP1_9AGAM|nr:hypothetical protein SCHPADRAFT_833389 [Schizopora paradoxa]
MTRNPEVDVYVKELSKLKYGYPLYDPDPAGSYDRVRIGDVGYVTHYGCFLRLFNVFFPEGHPINNYGVPEGFRPLPQALQEPRRSLAMQPGVICSSHVRRLEGGTTFDGGMLPAGLTVRLSCTDQQGAALIIKRPAVREDILSELILKNLLKKNYESWVSFARDSLMRDIGVSDLLLVSGHILTNEWATATVVEKTRNCEIQFSAGSTPFGNASASVWGSWTSSVSLPLRFGPVPLPPAAPETDVHFGFATGSFSNSSDSSGAHTSLPSRTVNEQIPNQCIFLLAYRILTRRLLPAQIKAAAEPRDESGNGFDTEKNYQIGIRAGINSDDDSNFTGDAFNTSNPPVCQYYHSKPSAHSQF